MSHPYSNEEYVMKKERERELLELTTAVGPSVSEMALRDRLPFGHESNGG